jgi:hypothetical protein
MGVECPENLSKHHTYCVEKCWWAEWGGHEISLVGILNPIGDHGEKGWGACFFRRVDEVRYLLEFFKDVKMGEPETVEAITP